MKIYILIYPSLTPILTKMKIAPMVEEQVFYKDILYRVTSVIHNCDESKIKIVLYKK